VLFFSFLYQKKYIELLYKKRNNIEFLTVKIEVKSGSYPNPRKNHILQLATYCQLIEDNYRDFVPYGIIIYKNSDFKIPFDPKLRFELESVINKMRGSLKNGKAVLNHNEPGKCRFCSMRTYCEEKLVE